MGNFQEEPEKSMHKHKNKHSTNEEELGENCVARDEETNVVGAE
jgi:hypothetical protein